VHDVLDAGLNEVQWDGTDERGNPVRSGIYFYRLEAGKTVLSRKMLLMK
jgi:flagellar hook assembly protein FlgD